MSRLITTDDIYSILKQTFPAQNDFSKCNYVEERQELLDFGIDTKAKLLDMLAKHKAEVLEVDSEDLDDYHIEWYNEEYGKDYVDDRVNKKFWFAYPGLLRISLELEFGEKYITYANKRDGIS